MKKILKRLVLKHILNKSMISHVDLTRAYLSHWAEKKEDFQAIGRDMGLLPHANVAVLAIFRNGAVDANIAGVIATLREKAFSVVVVNNGRLSADQRAAIESQVSLYHERPSGTGRDFASYRTGFLSVLEAARLQGIEIDNVLFLNDSIHYILERLPACLDDFMALPSSWKGITESSESSYHVSSWFFAVDRSIWSDERFLRYWRDYKTLHFRPYVIAQGEIGLSTYLNAMGKSAQVLFPSSRFIHALKKLPPSQLAELLPLLPAGYGERYLRRFYQCAQGINYQDTCNLCLAEIVFDQSENNQTAFWQLYACLHDNFAFVKKDIYARGVFSISQLRLFFDSIQVNSSDWSELFRLLVAVKDNRSYRGMAGLRRRYGID